MARFVFSWQIIPSSKKTKGPLSSENEPLVVRLKPDATYGHQNSNCALSLRRRASMMRCGVRHTANAPFSCITGFAFITL